MEMPTEQIKCIYCDELISKNARKCKHCGSIIDPVLKELEELKNKQSEQSISKDFNNNKKPYKFGIGHLLLTLLTGGFWLLIWLVLYLGRDKKIYQ